MAPIVVGAVTRPHGLDGAVRVKVFNEDTPVLAPGATVDLVPRIGKSMRLTVTRVTPAKATWIVHFATVTSIERAEQLRGAEIVVPRAALPPADVGEYYHVDLVGCRVEDAAGSAIGTVREVMRYPSVDALAVTVEGGEIEIPFVDGIVVSVDLETRLVRVDAGLLE